jgi:hypothetical protein
MQEQIVVPLAGMTMIVLLVLGVPFVRALARRWEHQPLQSPFPADVAARLERIEQAVEAVAIEIERISEGQRFTTKLLADRAAGPTTEPREPSPGVKAPEPYHE